MINRSKRLLFKSNITWGQYNMQAVSYWWDNRRWTSERLEIVIKHGSSEQKIISPSITTSHYDSLPLRKWGGRTRVTSENNQPSAKRLQRTRPEKQIISLARISHRKKFRTSECFAEIKMKPKSCRAAVLRKTSVADWNLRRRHQNAIMTRSFRHNFFSSSR